MPMLFLAFGLGLSHFFSSGREHYEYVNYVSST